MFSEIRSACGIYPAGEFGDGSRIHKAKLIPIDYFRFVAGFRADGGDEFGDGSRIHKE